MINTQRYKVTPSVVAEPDLKVSYYVARILHHIDFLEPYLRAEDKFVFGTKYFFVCILWSLRQMHARRVKVITNHKDLRFSF